MKKEILLMVSILALIYSVNAVRVGVVVEFPNGEISIECVSVAEGTNGYDVLESTTLDVTWSSPSEWGHALCGIDSTGCPSDNCFCSSEYWNFYIKEVTSTSWQYSPVGFDGGSNCGEHYCAEEGELLGFGYGEYGTEPENYSFSDVCFPGDIDANGYVSDTELLSYIDNWATGAVSDTQLLQAINYWAI